ncbi:hypothetical protein A9D60_17405 [Leisingera sp. JC1]|nr:hypothetical protein A9D60_17405 [Leisingera sp. JC1]
MRLLAFLYLMAAGVSGVILGIELHQSWSHGAVLYNPGGKLLFLMWPVVFLVGSHLCLKASLSAKSISNRGAER